MSEPRHPAEGCACDYPYLGAQLAGTPIRCERCRCLVLEDGRERIRVAHEKALAELDEWAKANPITRPIPPTAWDDPDPDDPPAVPGDRIVECSCHMVSGVHDERVPREDARVIPPAERDCNGYALGSSCGCASSADCPASRVIPPADGTDPDNPIIHHPGCSWETTPYCDCGADPERNILSDHPDCPGNTEGR